MTANTIHLGDCATVLKQFPTASIDLTVTSPPYDSLRAYHGFTFDFTLTAQELYRVTKEGGVVVWVIGDATVGGSETGTSFQHALGFKGVGFRLHDTMIYEKETPTWNITSKRYRQHTEYMFILSKGRVKTFNAICDQKVKNMNPRMCKANRNGTPRYELYTPKKEFTCRGNIWRYAVGGTSTGHPAVFPLQLAKDHILSWSNAGDTVIDCFMGSGTTALAALETGRNYVGVEVSEEYKKLAETRIAAYQAKVQTLALAA